MWIYMSLGVGLRSASVGVGTSAAEYSMVGGAPLKLTHQRNDWPRETARGFAIPASARARPALQPSRETPPPRWAGPVIDLSAEAAPVQRGQLIDILV